MPPAWIGWGAWSAICAKSEGTWDAKFQQIGRVPTWSCSKTSVKTATTARVGVPGECRGLTSRDERPGAPTHPAEAPAPALNKKFPEAQGLGNRDPLTSDHLRVIGQYWSARKSIKKVWTGSAVKAVQEASVLH